MYFCREIFCMNASEAILNYAVTRGGIFQRKSLLQDLASKHPVIKKRAVDFQISRLIASGTLVRKKRGEYQLAKGYLPEFALPLSETEKNIYQKLKEQFPFLEMCIWSPKVLSSFMLHVPNVGYSFVDVEKDGMETVFHTLQNMNVGRNILLAPSAQECERYLTGTDAIVVRQLIGQSPLTEVDGCVVPRIEKILVDAVGDNELSFAGGSEIYTIYEFALERNHVNKSKLMRYASRRNRRNQVEQILKTIEHDQSNQ